MKGPWLRLFPAALAASCVLWALLLVFVPAAKQSRLFYSGEGMLGDFLFPRLCAELSVPYGGVEEAADFARLKCDRGWHDTRLRPLMDHLGRCEWEDGFPPVLMRRDSCYLPFSLLLTSLFPVSHGGSLACTLLGWCLLGASLFFLAGRENWPWALALSFSLPVLYAVERGQLVLYSAAALTCFLACRTRQNPAAALTGGTALAVATVLKLTPAVFGLCYLDRRHPRWRQALFAAVIGLLLVVLPFFHFGGWEGFKMWIENAALNAEEYSRCGWWGTLPMARNLRLALGMDIQNSWISVDFYRLFDALLGGWCLYRGWRRGNAFLLCAAMLLLPSNMLFYTGVYLLPMLLLELRENRVDNFDLLCWFVVLCPLQLPLGASVANRVLADAAFLVLTFRRLLRDT